MPFYIYRINRATGDNLHFERQRKVSLGGQGGPFCKHVTKICSATSCETLEWEMTETDVLTHFLDDTNNHAFIIDLKPKVAGNVSLYRLRHVWGRSEQPWTPIALQLEALFVDHSNGDPESFKQSFLFKVQLPELVHEFLYLKGGTNLTDWRWGPIGSVNGTLLWNVTWSYFRDRIDQSLLSNFAHTC